MKLIQKSCSLGQHIKSLPRIFRHFLGLYHLRPLIIFYTMSHPCVGSRKCWHFFSYISEDPCLWKSYVKWHCVTPVLVRSIKTRNVNTSCHVLFALCVVITLGKLARLADTCPENVRVSQNKREAGTDYTDYELLCTWYYGRSQRMDALYNGTTC